MFHLKDLFSTAPRAGATGHNMGLASAAAIKARLAQLVQAEDAPRHVFSDEALVALLADEGIDLARRTVAKYRKMLGIPSSAQRRRAAKIAQAAGDKSA